MTAPNVWAQMNYVPPRGQCNHKQSVLSPRCPCLRFMLHPLKSASSYECDGCNHHASFHSMENKVEDEIKKRWEQEAKDRAECEEEAQQQPKKRVRAIEYQTSSRTVRDEDNLEKIVGLANANGKRTAKGRGVAKKKVAGSTVVAGKARGKVTEILEDDEDIVELD